MKLQELMLSYSSRYWTDKGCNHSYNDYYDTIFEQYKNKPVKILEIGLLYGSSLYLWDNYFKHKDTEIHGIDIQDTLYPDLVKLYTKRVKTTTGVNCYIENEIPTSIKRQKWDIIIDDGSHDVQHQLDFYKIYKKMLKKKGILIIEDVQSIKSLDKITKTYPELTQIDLRKNKDRYDDLLAVLIR